MKKWATLLALLGCILHATLLSWHVSSRMPASFDAARLAADLRIICHEATGGVVALGDIDAPGVPADSTTECPVCKGLVGFQLVVLAAAELGLLAPVSTVAFAWSREDAVFGGQRLRPRSRAPPFSA